MTERRYINLMSEMSLVLTRSRPGVGNDNAFSEAQSETQKYQPDYPCSLTIRHPRVAGARRISVGTTLSTIIEPWLATRPSKCLPVGIGK
jgi:hypothetical protein